MNKNKTTPLSTIATPHTDFTPLTPALTSTPPETTLKPAFQSEEVPYINTDSCRLFLEAYGLNNAFKHSCIAPIWKRGRLGEASCIASCGREAGWNDARQTLVDKGDYLRMVPALRLATMMLKHSESFMVKVLCADIKRNLAPGLWDWIHLDTEYVQTEDDKAKYRRCLIEMSRSCLVFMGQDDRDRACMKDNNHGWTATAANEDGSRVQLSQIHPSYLAFFSRDDYDDLDTDRKNRALLSLAVTLVHEVVHALFSYRVHKAELRGSVHATIKEYFCAGIREVQFHPTNLEVELGYAWEHFLFGYIISDDVDSTTLSPMKCVATKAIEWFYCKFLHKFDDLRDSILVEDAVVQGFFDYELWMDCTTARENKVAMDGGSLGILAKI